MAGGDQLLNMVGRVICFSGSTSSRTMRAQAYVFQAVLSGIGSSSTAVAYRLYVLAPPV